MNRKRVLISALVLALLAGAITVAGIQFAGGATERLTNGSFESGFYATPAGFVGEGWHWFHNGGQADYGFYDETWAPVIHDGLHSQMIEISTFGRTGSDADRYAGIYQTVAVVPGQSYELSLTGMLRALERRPVETDLVEEAIHRIKRQAMTAGEREVKSRSIGEWVMREVRGLDQVAYVRFASVYRSFEDVQAFRDLIERLEKDLTPEMLKSQMPLLGDDPPDKH